MQLKTVILGEDALNPLTWTEHLVPDIHEFLIQKFPTWPSTARIYHQHVAQDHDVTPCDELTAERLGKLPGPFYVVVYPGHPALIIAAAVAISLAATLFFRPKVPTTKNYDQGSANNSLSDRSNKERVGERIPDIFGTVRAIPDSLAPSYVVYDNHEQVEFGLYCLGRGSYEITDVKEGDTKVTNLHGTTVEIYDPHSPLYGEVVIPLAGGIPIAIPGNPVYRFGTPIQEPVLFPKKSSSFDGQDLRPPTALHVQKQLLFRWPNEILVPDSDSTTDLSGWGSGDKISISGATLSILTSQSQFNAQFASDGTIYLGSQYIGNMNVGDSIYIEGAEFDILDYDGTPITFNLNGQYTIAAKGSGWIRVTPTNASWQYCNMWASGDPYEVVKTSIKTVTLSVGSAASINLDGTYTVLTADKKYITLDSPQDVKLEWSALQQSSSPPFAVVTLDTTGTRPFGPYEFTFPNFRTLVVNFVAPAGLYEVTDHGNQYALSAGVSVTIQKLKDDGSNDGAPTVHTGTLVGTNRDRRPRALTIYCSPDWAQANTHNGRCMITVARTTSTTTSNQYVDDIVVASAYALCRFPPNTDLGNVTVIRTKTRATFAAQNVRDRKLNMLVTRRVLSRASNFTELVPTRSADEIIVAICTDPYLGRLTLDDLDITNIYDTVAEIKTYFGNDTCGEFCYTFDDANTSFEEMIAAVANAIFSNAYRRGNRIQLKFERPQTDSVLLFNHRNKLPGSEKRTVRFGWSKDRYDGVEFQYVTPLDDTPQTIYIPADMSAKNPFRIESVGVRSRTQAYYLAYRSYQKLRYQNVAVEFEATEEANILTLMDRILVADGTRPDTIAGEIIAQDGLTLTLDQDVNFQNTTFNSISESITATDSLTAQTSTERLREAVIPSDSVRSFMNPERIREVVAPVDNVSGIRNVNKSVTESVTATDSVDGTVA